VHIGARIAGLASEILVSRTVVDLEAGSNPVLVLVGDAEIKGTPGTWTLHRLAAPDRKG
jgi:hypothetical protein